MKAQWMGAVAGAVLAGAAWTGSAGAEGFKPGAAPMSPFAWAKSGEKAAFGAEATKAAGGKVIGGAVAAEGAWPWQVALMLNGEAVGPDAQFCGGTMLLDTWVLTAAHCVHMADEAGNWADLDPTFFSVLVGSNRLVPGAGDLVQVARVIRHPNYVGTAFDNDIALVKLVRAPQVPYATITVPDAEFGDRIDQPGVVTLVTGWGLVEGGVHPEAMHQTEIQMMDRNQCNRTMVEARAEAAAEGFSFAVNTLSVNEADAYALWDQLIDKSPAPMSANMLCSGTYEGGKIACSGDSGGPLVVPLDDGSYVQAGIVSWGLSAQTGKGCKEQALFSAYTRISNYVPWLEQTIAENP